MPASSRPLKALLAQLLIGTLVLGVLPMPPVAAAAPPPPPTVLSKPQPDAEARFGNAIGRSSAPELERTARALTAGKMLGVPPAREASQGPSLLRPADAPRPVPGIRRSPLPKGMLSKEVEPPRSPFDLVKHFPNEYLPPGVALPPPGSVPVPELRVRPSELRFALTPGGPLPAQQSLAVTAASRQGVAFELLEVPDWLDTSVRRGKASFEEAVIRVSLLERRTAGAVEGVIAVRNADDPTDVRRVPVRVTVVEGEGIEPLESYDEDGRLERIVRADGSIIDYEYDEHGRLTRIRYPDGSSVGYTYDDAGRRTSMVDGQGTTVYRYDEKGRLVAVYQPGFNPVRYKWDEADRLVALTYPHGKVVSYDYDEAGRLSSVHEDAGTTTYRYGEDGRLLGQTLPNGISTDYGYDEDGRIVEVLHENDEGELVLGFRYALDERGRTTRMERETADGVEMTTYDYDEAGRVVRAAYPTGRSASYEYDGLGNRLRMTETEGADVVVTDYYYDETGRLLQAGEETFDYDVHGNVAARYSPGRTVEYAYDFENRLVAITDGDHEAVYEYDGDGRRTLASIDGGTTRYGFDASIGVGEVLFEANAGQSVDRTYVYGLERLSRSLSKEKTDHFLYDRPLQNVAALVALSGEVAASYAYDVFGSPAVLPDETTFLFGAASYDPGSRLIHYRGRHYDPAIGRFLDKRKDTIERNASAPEPINENSNPRQVQAGSSAESAGSTEAQAEKSLEYTPSQVTIFQLNQLPARELHSRPAGKVLPFPKLTQFGRGDSYHRPKVAKSTPTPRLRLHPEYLVFAETAAGLLPVSQALEVSTSTGDPITFTIVENIPWLSIASSGGTASGTPQALTVTVDTAGLDGQSGPYEGDILVENDDTPGEGRKVRVRLNWNEDGSRSKLQCFDSSGRLQRLIKPDGRIADFDYDSVGRLARIRQPEGEFVEYTYNARGDRTSMTDSRGVTVYQYDAHSRLTAVYLPGLNPLRYTYDNAGNVETIAYPDGWTVSYTYDGSGRILRVSEDAGVTQYVYDTQNGLLSEEVLPNGLTAHFGYDTADRLTSVEYLDDNGDVELAFRYTLDNLGLRTSVVRESSSGDETTSYEYDEVLRLTRVSLPDGRLLTYSYDPAGNRLTRSETAGESTDVTTYVYGEDNRLQQAGEVLFQYDLNGNLVRKISPAETVEYSYDVFDRLVEWADGEHVVQFRYDGDGRRVGKIVDGVTTNYFNDAAAGLGHVLIEADVGWSVLKRYTYGLWRLARHSQGAPSYYLYESPTHSVAALSNLSGDLAFEPSYDPFGSPRAVNSFEESFLYAGEQYDDETGLIYLRNRYYDPAVGRFLTRDRIPGFSRLPFSVNPYIYAVNNPINFTDPEGDIAPALLIVGAVAAGVAIYDTWKDGHEEYKSSGSLWNATKAGGAGLVGNVAGYAPIPGFGEGARQSVRQFAGLQDGFDYRDLTYNAVTDAALMGGNPIFKKLLPAKFLRNTLFPAGTPNGILDISRVRESFGGLTGKILSETAGPFVQPSFNSAFDSVVDAFSSRDTSVDLQVSWQILNPSGYPSGSTISGGDLGGVSLNKTADLLLQIDDITGATYDELTGQLVLFGQQDVALPPMNLDEMAVAVNSVYSGEDPGVSIDPPIVNNRMSVRYEGKTSETEFGWIMFEADRVLKILSLGKDNLTGSPVTSNVTGYRSMIDRRLEVGCGSLPNSTRMWFQPKEVRLVRSADGQTMVFDEVSMELLYESKVGDQVVSDPQAAAFASHFTQNYDAFAAEWPILRDLERLGKVVAVMKWIKDNNLPIDLSFINNFNIEFFSTPVTTPVVSTSGTTGGCEITITGGVTYTPPNEYLSDDPVDPVTDSLRNDALTSRPSEYDFLWAFQLSASVRSRLKDIKTNHSTAVSQSFTRSRKDGNSIFREVDLSYRTAGSLPLSLVRYYDSFEERPGAFGHGWRSNPFELRFPVDKQTFTFGEENQSFELHARILLKERQSGLEGVYVLLGVDSESLPLYVRSGSMDLLRLLADGTYLFREVSGHSCLFMADGRLLTSTDSNGNSLTYGYDSGNRLVSITASDGRSITLTYNAESRVASASGPGGRQVSYTYDSSNNLMTVTNTAGQSKSYDYDADGNLHEIVDANGNTIFDATYDDYNRSPARRLGAAAEFAFDYNLEERRTVTVAPLGVMTEQSFDEEYRLRTHVDPLGNRTDVSYDGDFGPQNVTSPEGSQAQLFYDPRGNLTAVVDSEGGRLSLYYDGLDRLVASRDAEGIETAFSYDVNGNLARTYHLTSLQFDEDGNLTGFLYDPTNTTTYNYNSDGTLAGVTNPLDQTSQFTYDPSGLLDTATSPTGLATEFGFDPRSRLTSVMSGGSQVSLGYDDADNLSSLSTNGGNAAFEYDANGNLIGVTNTAASVTNFTYDADGNLTSVLDAALQTTNYTYDVMGRLTAVELPNGTRNEYEYDELGRPIVTLSGVGAPDPDLGIVDETLDFGSVGLGDQASRAFDIYNLAAVPLTISGVTAPAPFSTDFAGTTAIAPGDFLTVNVTFTPTAVGPAAADLTVTSDDPDDPVHLVSLTGVGTIKVLNLRASPASDGIQLDWDPFDPGAQTFLHFNIYRSTSPIPGDVSGRTPIDESLTDASETGFRDRSAEPGTSYHYAVTPEFSGFEPTAVDAVGPVAFFTSFDVLDAISGLATSGSDETRPAVAYNAAGDEFLLVYEKDASGAGTQLDLVGQRVDADGTLIGSPFDIAAKAVTERRPRLAYNSAANDYLVVFEEDFNGDGSNYVVYGQRVGAAGGLLGGPFFVGGFTLHETHPEPAYNSAANEYFVVFEMDGDTDGKLDAVGQRLNAAGAKIGGPFFVGGISVSGTPVIDQAPHLTYNATDDEYLVAYEVDVSDDGSDFEILGARFSGAGDFLSGPFFLGSTVHAVTGAALQDRNPFVGHDSGHNEYLTLWDVDVAGDGSNWSVASQKTDVLGAPISLLDGFLVVVDTAAQERNARHVYNPTADEHLLVWEEASAGDPRILARRYRLTDSSLLWGGVLEVAGGGAKSKAASDVRRRPDGAFNSTSNEMLVAWESDTGTGLDIEGRRLGNVAPALEVLPPSLDFGTATADLGLTVSNAGTGTLDWVANGSQPWLSASPASGSTTGSDAVTVSVDRTGLAPGDFNATLSVSSNGGNVDVPVSMTVANTPPDVPHTPLPADGASGQTAPDGSLDLTLSWQSGDANGDAVTYDLYFGTDSVLVAALDPSVRHGQGLVSARAPLSGLDFLTSYSWRVVAFDSRGGSTPGPVWSFTTASIPAPRLHEVQPDPTNLPRPVLSWQAVAGAAGYHLQLDDDPAFGSPLVDETGLAATSFTPSTDLPEGGHSWRVRSIDGNGRPGPFSTVDAFVADRTPPGVPSPVPVAPDPTRDARPDFSWSAVAGAASYVLQVSTDMAFTAPIIEVSVNGTNHEPVSSLPEGMAYWRVASRDEAGNQSAFSSADSFEIDLTSPPSVTGLSAMRSGDDVLLAWDPLAGPPADFDHFRVYRSTASFDNVSGMTPIASSLTDAAATSYTDTTATPGIGYFYGLTAVDGVGNEKKSVSAALLPGNLAPASPSVPGPADGEGGQTGPDVLLTWQASDPEGSALTYDVYLSTDLARVTAQDITSRVAQDLTAGSWSATGLSFLTSYYWRVVAFDAQDASTAGPVWSFTVGVASPVLVPLTPDPTNDPRPTFGWQAVAGAARYHIEIDDGGDFGTPIVGDDTLTATSFTPAADLPEGLLHWRVRAIDGLGQPGAFSPADAFFEDRTPPAVPSLTPVSPDPTQDLRPELQWSQVPGAVVYHLQVSTDPAFGSTLVDVTQASTSFTPATNLPAGTLYWRVSSLDELGNESAFPAADSFTVEVEASIISDGFESGNLSAWSSAVGVLQADR